MVVIDTIAVSPPSSSSSQRAITFSHRASLSSAVISVLPRRDNGEAGAGFPGRGCGGPPLRLVVALPGVRRVSRRTKKGRPLRAALRNSAVRPPLRAGAADLHAVDRHRDERAA